MPDRFDSDSLSLKSFKEFFEFVDGDLAYFNRLYHLLKLDGGMSVTGAKINIASVGLFADENGLPTETFADYFIAQMEETLVLSIIAKSVKNENNKTEVYNFLVQSWHEISEYKRTNFFKDCDIVDECYYALKEHGLF